MKHLIKMIALGAVFALIAASCGGDSDTGFGARHHSACC